MDYISYTILLSFLMTTFPYFYFMSQKKEFTNKFKKIRLKNKRIYNGRRFI